MRWSLRTQLLLPVLALSLGVIGLSAWVVAYAAQTAVRRQIEDQFRQVARTLNEATFPFTPKVLGQLKDLTGADYLLETATGHRLATLSPDPLAPPPADPPARDWHDLRFGSPVLVAGQSYLCARVRLRPGPADAGGVLTILYPEARWRDALWQAHRPALLLALAGSFGAVGLAVGLAHWLTGRVRSLEGRTRRIAAGDFRPMPVAGWDDELRDLAGSINDMARQLAHLQDVIRKTERLRLLGQVSGGLAHQLRNGIAGARLAVQVHARECAGAGDWEALDVALRQLTLVEEKLQRFLHLGRADRLTLRPLSVPGLVEEAVALFRPQCRHLNIDLRWQPPADAITVLGDRSQLGHLLVNVLGNAGEAAGPGGHVEVTVALHEIEPPRRPGGRALPTAATYAAIVVCDSGPGPPPEIADQLFDEFVTSKPEGVGLGLAVARRIAEGHGGRVAWDRSVGRTCFQILLPVAPPPADRGGVGAEAAANAE